MNIKNIFVTKYGGEKQKYSQEKVLSSITRSGIEKNKALAVLINVESKLFDGISTQKLYKIVAGEIEKQGLKIGLHTYKLREALAKMGSFDFEKFVLRTLEKDDYECAYNIIVRGECVEHQIDVIAQKQQRLYYVEVKHHRNYHRNCSLGTICEVQARLEDMKNGYGKNKYDFSQGWLFTNTKISDHAKQYAKCKNLRLTSWKFDSEDMDFEKRVKKLGPAEFENIIASLGRKKIG